MWGIPPELTHVPLSVYNGDEDNPEVRTESVSILDVHKTILTAAGVESDHSRGRNLLKPVESGEFLTEYHGLSDRYFQVLENNSITDYDHLDTELTGLAFNEYYGYEDFNGFREVSDSPFNDPQTQLRKRVAELEKRQTEKTNDIGEAVREQLEDLGYA
jgi:arylsulfatase